MVLKILLLRFLLLFSLLTEICIEFTHIYIRIIRLQRLSRLEQQWTTRTTLTFSVMMTMICMKQIRPLSAMVRHPPRCSNGPLRCNICKSFPWYIWCDWHTDWLHSNTSVRKMRSFKSTLIEFLKSTTALQTLRVPNSTMSKYPTSFLVSFFFVSTGWCRLRWWCFGCGRCCCCWCEWA